MVSMRLLLFSGGLDSTALAWSQRPNLCLTIDYGQMPAQGEIRAASGLSGLMGLRHEVLTVDLAHLGSGSLAGSETATVGSAPEWWPYRNQMLITLAAMKFVGQGTRKSCLVPSRLTSMQTAKNRSSKLSARWSRTGRRCACHCACHRQRPRRSHQSLWPSRVLPGGDFLLPCCRIPLRALPGMREA
ncbi:7-cyano-7-deazaguanine synthase [Rhizobium laguerreae]|uniref:7-cyano-7-deazaguanine synthase n=1 Tax=Rhizobium laguerreae TaxID=1076926 RepID=UPI0028ABE2F7|nr:7-cyano-7-deazaguanine synthase [Rhizobium laguerreae]